MEKEKKEIKMSLWTFYVLMTAMVLLITALIICGLKLYEKSKLPQEAPQTEQIKEENTKKTQEQTTAKAQTLDINSELVQKLYRYVNFDMLNINYNPDTDLSFYRTKKMTNDTLEDNIKVLSVLSSLWNDKKYEKISQDVSEEVYEYGKIYGLSFSIEDIQKKAQEMFNSTINNFPKTYEKFLCTTLEFDKNSYKYFEVEGGGDYTFNDITKLIKAEQKGDEIYIYDNYIREGDLYDELEGGSTYAAAVGFFASSDAKKEFAGTQDNFGYDSSVDLLTYLGYKLPVYKHTFKQRTDGTYYWVSSELTNKNELKSI